jgi:folate-binding protein YgfZ
VLASSIDRQVHALDAGRGVAELDDVSLTLVSGADARAWLHDLVTTDVESLGRFETRPSLVLTPTGRIRAAFHVLCLGERDLLLAQGPGQPEPIGEVLAPYVLSSDVTVAPSRLRVFALPGTDHPPSWIPGAWRPSVLGGGIDLVAGGDDEGLADVRGRLADQELERCDGAAVEARRVRRGEPAFPVDLGTDALPAEAGWDVAPVTDRTKGCFLGQEAVAKVANLGHPTHVVLGVAAAAPLRAGEPVLAAERDVGRVTSADGVLGLARIRWEAREDALVGASSGPLNRR